MPLLIWLAELAVAGLMLEQQSPSPGYELVYTVPAIGAIPGLVLFLCIRDVLRYVCGMGCGFLLVLASGLGYMDWLGEDPLPLIPGLVGLAVIGVSLGFAASGRG